MWISQSESYAHLCVAAAISTAMLGVGLRVIGVRRAGAAGPRWLWLGAGAFGTFATVGVALAELSWGNVERSLLGIAAAVLAVGIVGLALVRVGLRGRFAGDHPHCRRCGFDLFGKPAASAICNECGAPLDAAGAIVIGVRERRRGPLLIGAFAMILSAAVGASIGRTLIAGGGRFSTAGYKPASWLIDATFADNSRDSYEAFQELSRRAAAGELDDADVRRIVALGAQPSMDGNAAMFGAQLTLLAWERDQLDEPTMRDFVRRQARMALRLAPQSTPTRVPFDLGPASPLYAWGGASKSAWTFAIADRAATVGGASVPADAIVSRGVDSWRKRLTGLDLGDVYRLRDPLPAGPTAVEVRMTVTVTLVALGRPTLSEVVPVVVHGQTTIVPGLTRRFRDDGDATPLIDRQMTATIAIAPREVAGRVAATITFNPSATSTSRSFVGQAIACDVAGVERVLGDVCFDSYGGGGGAMLVDASLLPAGPLAIVLRPTPERAVEFVDDFPTYQHEIVIEASRVTRVGP